jgi:hypothetical protein
MGSEQKGKAVPPNLKYRRVEIAAIKRVRRGKHDELVQGNLRRMKL